MVQDHRGEYASLWAAIEFIAPKIGCVPQTLHEWVRKLGVDTALRDGVASEERDRIKALERGTGKQGSLAEVRGSCLCVTVNFNQEIRLQRWIGFWLALPNVGREWPATAQSALKNGDHDGRGCGSIRRTR